METQEPARTNLTRSRLRWWYVPLAAALGAGGYLAYRLATAPAEAPASLATAAPPAPDAAAAATTAMATAAESQVGPEGARALLEAASADPRYRGWLEVGELVRRWAVVTANVSEGTSPRRWLAPLAPRARFAVIEQGDRLVVAPEAWARYDGVADTVATLDARALAAAYRRLHGALDAAFRALGYPAGALDRATARALRRVEQAPVPAGEVAVVRAEGVYVFADQALERLDDVQKHLVRMGPRNERIVQAKARELREALALPEVAAAGR
jgi:hypothetical protein